MSGNPPTPERRQAAALTPEELSRRVMERARARRAQASTEAKEPKKIPRFDGAEPPLSLGQERLWLLDRLEPGNVSYNMPFPVWLRGPLSVRALASSRTEVARRQGSLRTRFADREGRPLQVIEPPRRLVLPVVDLSGLPRAIRRPTAERLLRAEASMAFDLARGPLWRMVLLRLEGESHAMSMTMHHIISDGWSIGVFYDEFSQLYAAHRLGKASPLEPLPVQYVDFAVWQRERVAGAVLDGQVAYWRERLAGAPAALDLPLDRPRPSVATNRGGLETLVLDRGMIDRLEGMARSENVTLFMLLLAVFQLLLSRLAGQQDLVIGAPAAGRGRVETERLIGFFLNPLVVRTDLSGNPTLHELLVRVRDAVLGAYGHQEVPFEKLLAEVQPERMLSRSPLFQVQFNMFEQPPLGLRLDGVEVEAVGAPEEFVKFDLNLYVQTMGSAEGRQFGAALAYNSDLFDRGRMAEMLAQFEHLARQVADGALSRPIAALSLLTPGAARALPEPSRAVAAGTSSAVHRLFAERAAADPERPALVDEQGAWSYGELAAAVNQLARWLLGHGVSRGDVVAIYADRSSGLGWAVLATLEAGAAFLILDSAYPAARLAEYVRTAAPRACLVLEGAGELPAELAAELDSVGGAERLSLPPRSQPVPAVLTALSPRSPTASTGLDVGPDDAACLTFTSGATGKPKAVVGRHGPLSWFMPQWVEKFGLGKHDCFGMLSALSHDPLQRDLFTPLCLGARAAIPSQERIGTPGRLAPWLREQGVSVLNLTPAMLELVSGDCARLQLQLPALAHAYVVGDLLKRDDVERLRAVAPSVEVVNLYGSTETQRAVSFHPVPPISGERARQAISLGRGFEGVDLVVLDQAGRVAGIGEVGELWLRSLQLARGYLGDPRLTADRFRPNPLAIAAAPAGEASLEAVEAGGLDRAYRTGDLGRYRPDGNVDFVGRADQQVQVRGFRVELGEIEAVLRRQPSVEACVVVAPPDARGETRLVAYLTPASGPGRRELRAELGREMPDYMVPSAFVRLERMPMTRTGKIDRAELSRREVEPALDGGGARAPEGPLEEMIADGWRELLELSEVAADDDFFALGGHSLMAIRLLARLRSALGVEIPLRALFEAPTVAGLAAVVATALEADRPPRPPLASAARRPGEPLALSFGQQRLWFLDQLEPGVTAYNLSAAVSLSGTLQPAAMAGAFGAIVTRHEALRSRFRTVDGNARLEIAEPEPFALPWVDLSSLAEPVRRPLAAHLASVLANRPFDLARGPLLRALLVDLGADLGAGSGTGPRARHNQVLALSVHHVAADGWSLGVLVRELGAQYAAALAGTRAQLVPLTLQYPDFARWQRTWLTGAVLRRELAFWTERFAEAPPAIELATDRPRPAMRGYRGHRRATKLPPAVSAEVTRIARQLGATPFMVLLAVWATLLSRSAHQDDMVVGTPVAGRGDPALDGMIGFFANTLALRLDTGRAPRFDQLVERIKTEVLEAFSHPDLPFERLVDELESERSLDRAPVFQVMFSLQNTPAVELELPGLTLAELPVEVDRAAFDLTMTVVELPDGLLLRLDAARDLFDRTTAERILRGFQALLAGALAEPRRPIAELPILSPAEHHHLLVESNDTARVWRAGRPGAPARIEELVLATARRVPDAVAVVAGSRTLTYGELTGRARRLGEDLAQLGIGPESRVGFAVERDPSLLVGLLGVLFAGGAYVPLDPNHPADRLAWILEDSGIEHLLGARQALDALPPSRARRLELERDGRLSQGSPATESHGPRPALQAEAAAYALYTSGSTGRPKGVEVAHRSVTNFLASMAERPGLGAADVLLAVTTLGFDISVLELLLPLSIGARVQLVDSATAADPALLMATLERAEATVMQATPATWRLLIEGGWPGRPGLKVLSGGEELSPDLARWLGARCGELWNVYGPTETTVWSAVERVEPENLREPAADGAVARAIPLGRPIANTSVVLTDRRGRPVPLGVAGELWIGGDGLARGYLGRAALTAERFVPDPAAGEPGARAYRTGDLARRRADGKLEYLGRLDAQVKVRGFRIELGEIETVLEGRPEVARAVAGVREDIAGERRLVAYLLAAGGRALDVAKLIAALALRLPNYMVPSLLIEVESLPLTSTGKVDRKALATRPLPADAGDRSAAFVAPRSRDEQVLAEVWAGVLGRDQVGVDDNFFALGGDSILAIRAVSRAADRGLRFTPRDLFRFPTIAQLAAVAEGGGAVDGQTRVALSPAQRGWLATARAVAAVGETVDWEVGEVVVIQPPTDVTRARLTAALDALLACHPALSARISIGRAGQPGAGQAESYLLPTREAATRAPWIASALAGEGDERAQSAIERALLASLDPTEGRMVAAAWWAGGEGDRLLLAAHPLAVDGASWQPLLGGLATLATDATLTNTGASVDGGAGPDSGTPPLVRALRGIEQLAREAMPAQELAEWQGLLDKPVARLPRDPDPDGDARQGSVVRVELSAAEVAALREAPGAKDAELSELVLAAVAQAVTGWAGARRIAVAVSGSAADRARLGIDPGVVGALAPELPVILEVERAFAASVPAVRGQLRGAQRLAMVWGKTVAERDGGLPPVEIGFGWWPVAAPHPGWSASPCLPDPARRGWALSVTAGRLSDALILEWVYDPARLGRRTAEALAVATLDALRSLLEQTDAPAAGAGGDLAEQFPYADLSSDELESLLADL